MLSALSAYRHTKRDRFVGVLGYLHVYGKLSETFKTNLAAKHPEKVAELRRLLDTFRGDTAAVMPARNPDPRQPFDAW